MAVGLSGLDVGGLRDAGTAASCHDRGGTRKTGLWYGMAHRRPIGPKLRSVSRDGFVLQVDEVASEKMSKVGSRDTRPEMVVRRCLHALGHHYRTRNPTLPGRPDVANQSRRWAVFVHGCYWHQHEGCPRATVPIRNREFWLAKFRRNRERDAEAIAELRRMGLKVVVVWECETKHPDKLARRLQRVLPMPERH